MASDSLRQVGRYMRHSGRQADLALKRYTNRIPKKDRARDTVSSIFPMQFIYHSEGKGEKVSIDLNFNKPPPVECAAECIATACTGFELTTGGHQLSLSHPYEIGSLRLFSNGVALDSSQYYGYAQTGQIYVQVQSDAELIVACYTYIIC